MHGWNWMKVGWLRERCAGRGLRSWRNELFLLAGSQWHGAAMDLRNMDSAKVTKRLGEGIGSLANLGGWYLLASEETTWMPPIHAFGHSRSYAFIHACAYRKRKILYIDKCLYL